MNCRLSPSTARLLKLSRLPMCVSFASTRSHVNPIECVCVCACVFVCACMHGCMCVCVCVHAWMYVCVCACVASAWIPHHQLLPLQPNTLPEFVRDAANDESFLEAIKHAFVKYFRPCPVSQVVCLHLCICACVRACLSACPFVFLCFCCSQCYCVLPPPTHTHTRTRAHTNTPSFSSLACMLCE